MLIERWKSKVKNTFRWITRLRNRSLKSLKFWFPVVMTLTQIWVKKGPKLVPHVLIVIERWKSKAKETLKWNIRLWNFFLKILKSKPHVVTSSSQNWLKKIQCVHHVQLGVKLFKSFFSDVRILKHRLWRHYCNPSKSP